MNIHHGFSFLIRRLHPAAGRFNFPFHVPVDFIDERVCFKKVSQFIEANQTKITVSPAD
jgi:hypothetical protein